MEHLSQIGLIRNFATGHVGPCWHVVYDNKFEMVYSSRKPTNEVDKICNKLFETNRELYAEDKFDDKGTLIYCPLPLHNVWLT